MTTYHNSFVGDLDEEFVNGNCTVCGLPRRKCAEALGDPYVPDTEETK